MIDSETLEKLSQKSIIPVLDHGHVRYVDHVGGDLAIVRSARISHDAQWRAGENTGSDNRLINFLKENGHNTPFESTFITFEIKAPILVLRQWHRHRTQSYNEVSARYTELPEEFYIPEPHLVGKQNPTNKQVRDPLTKEEYESLSEEDRFVIEHMLDSMRKHNKDAFELYKAMLSNGMPRELARSVLPVSTYSTMFCSMNLHNLYNFLWERAHPHAQYEIRVYAEEMLKIAEIVAPVATKAFKKALKNRILDEKLKEDIKNVYKTGDKSMLVDCAKRALKSYGIDESIGFLATQD